MKDRKLIYALILSMAFNFAFLGALGYRLWEKREHRTFPPRRVLRSQHLHGKDTELAPEGKLRQIQEDFLSSLHPIRMRLFQERRMLGELLLKEEPDSASIEEQLHRIEEAQLEIERRVAFHLLNVRRSLPPEERKRFLDVLVKKWGRKLNPPLRPPCREDTLKRFEESHDENHIKKSRRTER